MAGVDILTAIHSWWAGTALPSLFPDGQLHHKVAPEDTPLPYLTFFKVSDVAEQFTTAFALRRATVQFNVHSQTDTQAQNLADQISDSMRTLGGNTGAVLTVYGNLSLMVLPTSFGIDIGEGLGLNGADCWVCHFEAETLFTE